MCLSCNVEDSCHQWSDPAISVGLASQVWHWFLSCNPELYNLKTGKDPWGGLCSLSPLSGCWTPPSPSPLAPGHSSRPLFPSHFSHLFHASPLVKTSVPHAWKPAVCLLTTELSLCRHLCTVILPAVLSYHLRFIRGKTEAWKRLGHYPELCR